MWGGRTHRLCRDGIFQIVDAPTRRAAHVKVLSRESLDHTAGLTQPGHLSDNGDTAEKKRLVARQFVHAQINRRPVRRRGAALDPKLSPCTCTTASSGRKSRCCAVRARSRSLSSRLFLLSVSLSFYATANADGVDVGQTAASERGAYEAARVRPEWRRVVGRLPAYFRELTGTPEPTDTTERTFTPPAAGPRWCDAADAAASDIIDLRLRIMDRLWHGMRRPTEQRWLDENGCTRSLRQLLR